MNLNCVRGFRLLSHQNRATAIVPKSSVRCYHHPVVAARRHSTASRTSTSPSTLSSNCQLTVVTPSCTRTRVHHKHFTTSSTFHKIIMAPKGSEDVPVPEVISPKLYFVKMTENAATPTKGSKLAAGYDLMSAYDAVVPKRGSALVKTDIQIRLPAGTYGRIAPRSGLAWKNKLDVGAGVIDEDYRGNIGVILFNHSDEDFAVTKGDRIAQLICEKICYPEIVELDNLDETERGEGGFGSTGVKKAKLDEPKLELEAKSTEVQAS